MRVVIKNNKTKLEKVLDLSKFSVIQKEKIAKFYTKHKNYSIYCTQINEKEES